MVDDKTGRRVFYLSGFCEFSEFFLLWTGCRSSVSCLLGLLDTNLIYLLFAFFCLEFYGGS